MLILRDSSLIPLAHKGAVIALGNFDGLHLGHHEVLRQTLQRAQEQSAPAGILTFEPHPRRVFKPDLPPLRLLSFHEKACLLKEAGLDFMRIIRFTPAFARTPAREFVESVLLGQLQARHIVTGDDFVFGNNRTGTTSFLAQMAGQKSFGYTQCDPVEVNAVRCSSTRIRELLAQGSVQEAALLLGRPYRITGIVRTGDQRGRQIGFPTANILPHGIFLPAYGVYAVHVHAAERILYGVANLGLRPTFSSDRPRLEVHLFDFTGSLYGQHLQVEFVHYIRPERKFESLEALKQQIREDCEEARRYGGGGG